MTNRLAQVANNRF